MKKFLAWLLILSCIMLPALGEESFTLRGDISFGLSKDEVLERERKRGVQLDWFFYDIYCNIENDPSLFYYFDEDEKLIEVQYCFEKDISDLVSHNGQREKEHDLDWAKGQYDILEQTLYKKYGRGVESNLFLNEYVNSGNEMVLLDNVRRRVPYKDGYIVIEHVIAEATIEVVTEESALPEKPASGVFSASHKGFKSEIYTEAAFDRDGKITYIAIGDDKFAETDGIGTQVLEKAFMAQFIGKQMPLALTDIDAISGATVSSKAVVEALNKAYDQSKGVVVEEPAEPTMPEKPAEGVYGASSKGFAGPVWVELTLDGDKIAAIKIGDDRFAETTGLGSKALEESFAAQFVGKQLPIAKEDIDVIASATVTTDAVISAINKAYQKSAPAAEEVAAPVTEEAPAAEYIGVGKGFGGEIKVKVTMEGDKIAAIEILSHQEVFGLSDKSLKEIPAAIIANQSTDFTIDTATMGTTSLTNKGIIEAVNDALSQNAPVTEEVSSAESSVLSASATGFAGPVWVEITLNGNKIASIKIGDDRFVEISGMGAKVQEESFAAQFVGKQLPIAAEDIDAIAGATITTNAVIKAINKAYSQKTYEKVTYNYVCYNIVTYKYMTAEEYEYKLIETQVQDYLNDIL